MWTSFATQQTKSQLLVIKPCVPAFFNYRVPTDNQRDGLCKTQNKKILGSGNEKLRAPLLYFNDGKMARFALHGNSSLVWDWVISYFIPSKSTA